MVQAGPADGGPTAVSVAWRVILAHHNGHNGPISETLCVLRVHCSDYVVLKSAVTGPQLRRPISLQACRRRDCGAEKPGVGVQDDLHGYLRKQLSERMLVEERAKEAAV